MRPRSPLANGVTKTTGIFMLSLESGKPWSSDTAPAVHHMPWNCREGTGRAGGQPLCHSLPDLESGGGGSCHSSGLRPGEWQ